MDASIQLYSLRDSGANLRQQLERVAKIGYKGVEFCGYEDISANEMKALLAGHGLTPTGTHVGPDIFFGDIDGQIEYCAETGIKYLILPWADLNRAEDIKKVAEILNSASEKAKKSGVVVGYHNHAHEFNKIGGEYILDLLFKSLEKDVIMQLDLYWIRLTGIDPVDYINKHADVCRSLHLKALLDVESKENCDVGDGIIDFKACIAAGKNAGADSFVVEQEECRGSIWDSITKSLNYLRTI